MALCSNKILFSVTISCDIKFTTVECMPSRTINSILNGVEHVNAVCVGRGFVPTTALMDGEFVPLRDHLLNMNIVLNTTLESEHVPKVERQIRVIKERTGACRHSPPFKSIPELMVVAMIKTSVMWINAFPPKGGVSPTVSPCNLPTEAKLDFKKHCKLQFGSFVQTHEENDPKNSMDS